MPRARRLCEHGNVKLIALSLLLALAAAAGMRPVVEVPLGSPTGQLRAAPVRLGPGAAPAFMIAYGPDVDVDPYHEMFFYPRGTLTLAVVTHKGEILWKRDLGRGVVPGIWFTPFFPFDLDGDGVDEIWFVNNVDPDHPLSIRGQRLERVDARTGKTLERRPWPSPAGGQVISATYRNFILGGMVKGRPVLVTAQGTYGPMALQAWNSDMTRAWEHKIPAGPSPRGSHMCPVVDLDNDGVEEVLWGERLIDLASGEQRFCADCDSYSGHSDVIQPFLDWSSKQWRIFTCRESGRVAPRVATFDAAGKRLWGDLEQGHIDTGWVANLGPKGVRTALAIRIDSKSLGPDGLTRTGVEEFVYDPYTGARRKLPFSAYGTLPADIDGDGYHELLKDGKVLDANGRTLATYSGTVAMASKILDLPGEQLLTWSPEGVLRVWSYPAARDTERARARYAHPFYKANQRLTATGYNLINLGGL